MQYYWNRNQVNTSKIGSENVALVATSCTYSRSGSTIALKSVINVTVEKVSGLVKEARIAPKWMSGWLAFTMWNKAVLKLAYLMSGRNDSSSVLSASSITSSPTFSIDRKCLLIRSLSRPGVATTMWHLFARTRSSSICRPPINASTRI